MKIAGLIYPLKVALGCLGYASYFLSKVVFVVLIFPVFLIMLPFFHGRSSFSFRS